ncbi:PREDICTED: very long-chain-fatty-acid--CoA ligase bubblegum-like [Trachymyrmex cornetzi]|uniref:long-chain-fatty-acid--CoA ligase n=1 Tax=Trachymyrmex cornetzi TaxID=471704 RepID=A0A195DA07_9HYME|nr:PREDICTED: very long-chain-fatty-acid--CoA ligase bubblegum-like [Trachymyrmex cornetzi]XP_018376146.1 PREDICTED: very long-chain-fatty-acid--CoA ligase bubblegum-like [Trachymyrmex cornetzi]XP_018376147.1 PREDICTED: very long-chain-fatty-acid--CoA ligase bubblegum-like [Trachymyrmex cornetzi]XP_018376148.1 PREDICTED: very long-chain-fatty-acid--CoA ligase bubblegum-like [Trachymyrmex cornetzi]KYN09718.1 Long-chain-fatty-acid--CoA ligase ACSBG2 [Trachymyrmex cornetzi]
MNQSTTCTLASETGLDGPDQVLSTDIDATCNAGGRVRIKLDSNGSNSCMPVSIPGVLTRTAKLYPDHIALVSRPDVNGKRATYTFQEYESVIRIVAKAFLKLGLERYHSVCIMGFNSPEWFIADLATIYAGGIATGIYITNSPKACQYCAEDSRANIIVVEDEKQLRKILQIKHNLPHLKAIVQYNGIPTEKDVLSWNDLLDIGKKESEDKLLSVLKTIGVNECCILVYTSGTVGSPKAVMLNHDNVLFNLRALLQMLRLKEKSEIIVSYLPLSHMAAQLIDIVINIMLASTVYFADPSALKGTLINTLLVAQPTFFVGVPRVWEKIYEKMQENAHNNGVIKTCIAKWAKAQALHYYTNKINGMDYKHWGYVFAKWLVFDKVKAALGLNKCQIFGSSAAPLNIDIKKYFLSLDMPLLEGYGMSECSGAHTLNDINKYSVDGVGKTLPGLCTKLDNIDEHGEGEICMSGRHIFMGYLNAPEKIEETKDKNGWLHSGDLGKLDSNGNLFITGRIKDLIITSGGENVAPYNIEQSILSEIPYLSNATVIGDRRKYLTVLVTLKSKMNEETGAPLDTLAPDVLKWAHSIGSSAKTVTEVINSRDTAIYEEIDKAIKRANMQAISNAQKVQKFEILPHDFSIPTGELGPTLKLKRNVVQTVYADLINKMYE